jgi:hypothetical protein
MTITQASVGDIPSPGSIVKVRGREWIALPQNQSEKQEQVLKLRPLGGGDQSIATLYWPLEGAAVKPASFEPPDPSQSGSQSSALLLRDALLLKLRAGAGPFRSLGNVALEPRPYQLVPLLMALKQPVTRVLIADEVGLGKTVEALLIARELLDRGEIRKVTVICPPHLCEKWRADMQGQFNLAAEVVRPGTAQKLERGLPAGKSIFDVIPFTVVSLDWIKSDRNREGFLRSCGEFVIVDEAHTCAARKGGGRQQRYELLRGLSQKPERHLVLLTATTRKRSTTCLGCLIPNSRASARCPKASAARTCVRSLVTTSSSAAGLISKRSGAPRGPTSPIVKPARPPTPSAATGGVCSMTCWPMPVNSWSAALARASCASG